MSECTPHRTVQKLCKSLGIKILPFMEIIAGSKGKIEGFSCGPSKISLLVGKLEDTTRDYCDAEDIECTRREPSALPPPPPRSHVRHAHMRAVAPSDALEGTDVGHLLDDE